VAKGRARPLSAGTRDATTETGISDGILLWNKVAVFGGADDNPLEKMTWNVRRIENATTKRSTAYAVGMPASLVRDRIQLEGSLKLRRGLNARRG
jgi:hypothetical protein